MQNCGRTVYGAFGGGQCVFCDYLTDWSFFSALDIYGRVRELSWGVSSWPEANRVGKIRLDFRCLAEFSRIVGIRRLCCYTPRRLLVLNEQHGVLSCLGFISRLHKCVELAGQRTSTDGVSRDGVWCVVSSATLNFVCRLSHGKYTRPKALEPQLPRWRSPKHCFEDIMDLQQVGCAQISGDRCCRFFSDSPRKTRYTIHCAISVWRNCQRCWWARHPLERYNGCLFRWSENKRYACMSVVLCDHYCWNNHLQTLQLENVCQGRVDDVRNPQHACVLLNYWLSSTIEPVIPYSLFEKCCQVWFLHIPCLLSKMRWGSSMQPLMLFCFFSSLRTHGTIRRWHALMKEKYFLR